MQLLENCLNSVYSFRDVPNLDTDGPASTSLASDPICGVFSDGKEIGRTEFLKDSANPVFKNTIDFTYTPGANQQLTFSLYDLDYVGADRQVAHNNHPCDFENPSNTSYYREAQENYTASSTIRFRPRRCRGHLTS